MTRRDRLILIFVVLLGTVAAFWLLAMSPKLKDLSTAKKDVSEAETAYAQSRKEAEQFAQARLEFPRAYARVARLGKAVPVHIDEASLVYQLAQAADRANVAFKSFSLAAEGSAAAAPAPAAPAASSEGGDSGGGDNPPAGGDQPAAPVAPAAPVTTSPGETLGSVTADATLTAAVSTGTTTGAANLRVMHFELVFQGGFFRLEDLVRNIKRLSWTRTDRLVVEGRLLTVDSVKFENAGEKVTLQATSFLLPQDQGLFAGATPSGPGGIVQGAAQAVSTAQGAGTPPSATVSP